MAQWQRPRGREFEPQRCHCAVSSSKTHHSKLSTGSPQEDLPSIAERLLMRCKESNLTRFTVITFEFIGYINSSNKHEHFRGLRVSRYDRLFIKVYNAFLTQVLVLT